MATANIASYETTRLLTSLAPLPLRLEMKGLVCLASRTCADGMWYYVMINAQVKFIFLCFVVNDNAFPVKRFEKGSQTSSTYSAWH